MKLTGLLAFALVGAFGCAHAIRLAGSSAASSSRALVLTNGIIYTLDPARPRAEVAVIVDGVFSCVGTAAECETRMPRTARVVDMAGGSATPGLVDAHGHMLGLGLRKSQVDLGACGSEAACVERLAARARVTPNGAWVIGRGWDQTRWPGQRFPSAETLSRAIPDHPVFARRVDGHAAWVNAAVLAIAGIGRDTPDPSGGHIGRDAEGRPDGLLLDNAQDAVTRHIAAPTASQIEAALGVAADDLVAAGLTSVHDAGASREVLAVYAKLALEHRLKLRVYAMLDGSKPLEELRAEMASWKNTPELGRLTVRSVKLYADGAMGSRGALMFEPYADDPKTSGLSVTEPEDLRQRILAIADAGFQPAVHAIGDRACAETLADFREASRDNKDLRPRVEHMQILRPEDVHLLVESGAVASMQPTHATSDGPWAEARLGHGTSRQKGAYAWRQAITAGATLACGSDFPVEDFDPRAGLYSAETRTWSGGPPEGWMPEQKLSREEALRCFTVGPAFAAHAEAHRGLIKEGYDADVTVFGRDIFAIPAPELKTLPVMFTIVGGQVEFARAAR